MIRPPAAAHPELAAALAAGPGVVAMALLAGLDPSGLCASDRAVWLHVSNMCSSWWESTRLGGIASVADAYESENSRDDAVDGAPAR